MLRKPILLLVVLAAACGKDEDTGISAKDVNQRTSAIVAGSVRTSVAAFASLADLSTGSPLPAALDTPSTAFEAGPSPAPPTSAPPPAAPGMPPPPPDQAEPPPAEEGSTIDPDQAAADVQQW